MTEISSNSFWRKDGMDYIADLGTMKKAIVVRYFVEKFNPLKSSGGWYSIGMASYFPFTQEQYDKRFDNHLDCINYAESIVKSWLKSILLNYESNSVNNLID